MNPPLPQGSRPLTPRADGRTKSVGGGFGAGGAVSRPRAARSPWKAVAIPAEHGGWGLTAEAVLLGLLVRPSVAGVAIGVAALLAFLARTPLKLAAGDRRRHRRLGRTELAERVAGLEMGLLGAAVVVAATTGQRWWWAPVVASAPFFAVELSFDIRSRGRRLVPELCGAIGMGGVATSIGLAGGLDTGLAIGLWFVLAARALAAVPFARTQVRRLKHQADQRRLADVAQVGAGVVALAGWALGLVPWPAVVVIAALAAWNLAAMRGPVTSAKRVGVLQGVAGLVVVAVAAVGVLVGA